MELKERKDTDVAKTPGWNALCDDFLYNLKSSVTVKCFGCSANISSTRHLCRTSRLFPQGHWFSKERDSKTYATVRRENFQSILRVMLASGQLELCERSERHLLDNIDTKCPSDEAHCIRCGDKFVLPEL